MARTSKRNYRLIITGIVLILLGLITWNVENSYNPKSVFWGMLNKSLTVDGVTRHVIETTEGQNLDEDVILELGKTNIAESNSTLSQGSSLVSTETISTPTQDYTRYVSAKSTVKNSAGLSINFSNIIGVWSKSPSSNLSSDPLDHLFGQTLLGIVPMANLPINERMDLYHQIRATNVFSVNFSQVKKGTEAGRDVDIYSVKVNPVAYADLLQVFAAYEGFKNVPELNPASYQNDQPLEVQFGINPKSRQLVEISYSGTNHVETYSDYNVQPVIKIPTNTISTTELEERLTQLE